MARPVVGCDTMPLSALSDQTAHDVDTSAGRKRPPAARSAPSASGPKVKTVKLQELGIKLEAATTDDLNRQIRNQSVKIISKVFVIPYESGVSDNFDEFYNNKEDAGFQTVFRDLIDSETNLIIETQVQRAGARVIIW